jgi:RNA polymerase sigma factor (sigma-70 family)
VTGSLPFGYREEIGDCYKVMSGPVYAYLTGRVGLDRASAEDLVQEVFQEAAKGWSGLRVLADDERLAWLNRVARNKAIDRFRHEQVAERKLPFVRDRYAAAAVDVFRQAITSMALQRFIEVVDSMPPVRRKAAFLHWRCGWQNHEIAKALKIKESGVSVHLSKARQTLMKELRDYDPHQPEGDD